MTIVPSYQMSGQIFLAGSGTAYTVPANHFAIITIVTNSASGNTVSFNTTINFNLFSASPMILHMGPGQKIQPDNADIWVVGTEFVNVN